MTRPLGASLGDYLSQSHDDGGLGLGTVLTSAIFLVAILATVTYLTMTKKDTIITADLPQVSPENLKSEEDELATSSSGKY